MALEKYKEKRNPSVTSEPFGGKSRDKKGLIFTVQKHAATRLHYDFRLEMDGVLKSWAVPKGPAMDPSIKRLAMMVEDHPFDYRDFEGIIPKGEYGAGTVIVWDEGTYEPSNFKGKTKKDKERHLLQSLESGQLKITLYGHKLKGEFAFVRTSRQGENSWLMIKHRDEFATTEDITLQDKSVQSGKTIDDVKKTSTNIYGKTKDPAVEMDKKVKSEPISKAQPVSINAILKKAIKSKMPASVKPMLATLVDDPFDDPGWIFEVKWDGYRIIAFIEEGDVQMSSRNNKSFTEKYYPITDALKYWKFDAVIDGEIMVLNEKGVSNFSALQNWRSEADGQLVMYVFDILWYEGKNLMGLPLTDRLAVLNSVFPTDNDIIRLSEAFPEKGLEFFEAARELGLEGIIAKKADSIYTPDFRSKNWLKIKVHKRQEVVIGGYTINEGTGKLFSALLLGVNDNGKLRFVGKVGTGFTDKLQKEMMELFRPLVTKSSPFSTEPDVNSPSRFRPNPPHAKAVWLQPELVCEIVYSEMTSDGVFRHPSFKGMRTDKKATEVITEKESDTRAVVEIASSEKAAKSKKMVKAPVSGDRKSLLNPNEETQVKVINGHELKFTNLSKVYWPEEGYTKRDMFNYYYRIAEYIIPYLKDRPQSLNRFPNGIHGQSFYQKNVKGKSPDWVRTFPYTTSDGEQKEFLVGSDDATLLWMASLGCIEMNPWFSRVRSEDYPDFCIIDLDPDKNTFDQVIEAALMVKKVLDTIGVPSFPKTSGSTGIHIYIPLGAKYTYDQSQIFARLIATLVHQQLPEYTTIERMISNREGKMYLDFLQNRPGATIASPYSLRPKPGATVSTPLYWEEVKKGLKMQNFTIKNVPDRLKTEGDVFKGVLDKGIDMEVVLKKAESLFDSKKSKK
ncbi:MAG TPA: DNA ligase D [Bacteroidales bacterium]|jgi:bifunctional non-homologous end joining protein LigD|nr:DNA ligase D [Bacteroidales bacterium]